METTTTENTNPQNLARLLNEDASAWMQYQWDFLQSIPPDDNAPIYAKFASEYWQPNDDEQKMLDFAADEACKRWGIARGVFLPDAMETDDGDGFDLFSAFAGNDGFDGFDADLMGGGIWADDATETPSDGPPSDETAPDESNPNEND